MTQMYQTSPMPNHSYQSGLSTNDHLDMLLGSRGIVVIAPHPDDDILGCGALMAATIAQGRSVHVIYLTDGGASIPDLVPEARKHLVLQRQEEAINGLKVLGIASTSAIFVGAPDGHLDNSKAHRKLAIYKLHELILQGSVSAVFVTSPNDAHVDHQTAYKVAISALRSYPGIQLYTYPVSSRIDQGAQSIEQKHQDVCFETSDFETQKRAALACHTSQLQTKTPHQGFIIAPEVVELMCTAPEYFASVDLPYDN